MDKLPYKVVPCIHHTTKKKGYKVTDSDGWNYCPDGKYFTVYYKYQDAEDVCDHLNGEGKVWGIVTKNSWENFKDFMRYPK